ncbi:hypothetical protein AB0K09_08000 [Streptomyces sp. NPDC049577]|uniref:hypothetical protein n=1 Tax=Streptomyces sp. NPDC049577 TaxID=3155153 RepID=UPI00341E67A0
MTTAVRDMGGAEVTAWKPSPLSSQPQVLSQDTGHRRGSSGDWWSAGAGDTNPASRAAGGKTSADLVKTTVLRQIDVAGQQGLMVTAIALRITG